MQMSSIHKTSNGKWKNKGKKKPVAIKQAKAKTKAFLAKFN
jgi:hypothetical protein